MPLLGIERLKLSNTDTLLTAGAAIISVQGGLGNDFYSVTGAGAVVTDTGGINTFFLNGVNQTGIGGSGADTYQIFGANVGKWASGMTVQGGAGLDTVFFQPVRPSNPVFSLDLDLGLNTISGIDRIVFSSPQSPALTNHLTLSDGMMATADADQNGTPGDVSIEETNAFAFSDFEIDASELLAGHAIRFGQNGNFSGNDTVLGGAGGDLIAGDAGNDSLVGNAGADGLEGGDGNDTITGGEGQDRLIGGSGGDVLVLSEATQVQDTIRFDTLFDGSLELNTSVAETTADSVLGFNGVTDRIELNRAGLGLGAGGVVALANNGAWNLAAGAVFIMGASDTTTKDDFGLMSNFAALSTDAAVATGSTVGHRVLIAVSNVEQAPVRRTGLYVWTDSDGDGVIEATDGVHLLGVLEGVVSSQLTAADFLRV